MQEEVKSPKHSLRNASQKRLLIFDCCCWARAATQLQLANKSIHKEIERAQGKACIDEGGQQIWRKPSSSHQANNKLYNFDHPFKWNLVWISCPFLAVFREYAQHFYHNEMIIPV